MDQIWYKNYPKGVPKQINPEAFASINDIFKSSCEKYSQKVAFNNFGTTLTYSELLSKSRDFAAYLQQQLGIERGARVAIMMPNLLQYPIALFASLRIGAVVVNINPLYTPRELGNQLNDAKADAIIVMANFAKTVEEVLPKVALKHVIVTHAGDCFPSVKGWIADFILRYVKRQVPDYNIPQAKNFKRGLQQGRRLKLNEPELDHTDLALLQYTGGTTGVAKGAMLTHGNIIANLEQISAWIDPFVRPGKEVVITALPLYHIFSFTANCLTFMKIGGENILITNPRDIGGFIDELAKHKFSAITGVNTLFNGLVNHSKFKELDFSHLRLCLGGGMPVQQAVAEQWHKVTGHPLLEAYGLTETSPGVCINPLNLEKYNGTVGLPLPSTEISIRSESGEELGIGEEGELWVRGPQVMPGYWQHPDETAKVLSKDGWLDTGDMAIIDEEGFVRILERTKDMILVSGFNVYPNEVEAVIAAMPEVLEVAVVGEPHPVSGEAVKAFIVKKDDGLTAEQVKTFCRDALTGYKIPRKIEFRDQLPKSNVGKILRRELK